MLADSGFILKASLVCAAWFLASFTPVSASESDEKTLATATGHQRILCARRYVKLILLTLASVLLCWAKLLR